MRSFLVVVLLSALTCGSAAAATLVSIRISPTSACLGLGTTRQFKATGAYSDGSTQDLTDAVTWSSANSAVMTMSSTGTATGRGVGSTAVRARSGSVSGSTAVTVDLAQVPPSFFGMHFNPSHTVTLPYGRCRVWDVRGAYWADIEPARGIYDFTALDQVLAAAKQSGIDDGCIFTFGYVPQWASSNPADNTCDVMNGMTGSCWLPTDLNFDGSGTDETIAEAIASIAAHVNDPTYLRTHAHIRYWEPFNEPYRSSTISGTICTTTHTCSYNGSYAQLVRIAEDMRCIIKGVGSVNGTPCSREAIDGSASILTPSGQTYFQVNGQLVVANFLNCNQSPRAGSGCTTGSRGSAATDVVNFHCYVWDGNADDVSTYIAESVALLSPVDAAKPFFCDEGSWGTNQTFADPDLQAGFVARWFVGILLRHVTTAEWFSWDNQGWGTLWNPQGKNGCTQAAGCLTKAGIAYAQTYDWLVGTQLQGCQTSAGITTCTLTRPNGYQALMVWYTAVLTDCAGQASPEVCGSMSYAVPDGYVTKRDLDGSKQPATAIEYVGAKPILLENQ
ncbi:MAG TPA: Ig-like domain-containing protein [Verrucomicrobiae bacterium]|nr:Ig-like domain-containing protein [Verrucomicrobiae bacterium]